MPAVRPGRRRWMVWGITIALAWSVLPVSAQETALPERARSAREIEDLGGYSRTVDLLRELRADTAPDADLELALALDEARVGELDSAATRLWSPLLGEALGDSADLARRGHYFWGRDNMWLNGKFDGWYWYVARGRAEVAFRQGRWDVAYEAARQCVAARALSGKEWAVLAACAARAGRLEEAVRACERAAYLDSTIPEPFYLRGVLSWEAGRRSEAQQAFREAMRRDSSWRPPAIGLVRSRLPGSRPDSLPGWLLAGNREPSLLTSAAGPKPEQFVQMDQPAVLLRRARAFFPADLRLEGSPPLVIAVLIDERGRHVLHELPWIPEGAVPDAWVAGVVGSLARWEFRPAMRHDQPQKVWIQAQYTGSGP